MLYLSLKSLPSRHWNRLQLNVIIVVPADKMNLSRDYKEYTTITDSGSRARRIFYPTCGSPVATFPERNKNIVYIKAGILDDEIQKTLKPEMEVYTKR